jgi:hypothetical protein
MAQSTVLAHDHSELDAALARLVSALADGDAERSLDALDVFWARLARAHPRGKHPSFSCPLAHSGNPSRIDAVSGRLDAHNALEESQVYLSAAFLLDSPEQTALNENIRREL